MLTAYLQSPLFKEQCAGWLRHALTTGGSLLVLLLIQHAHGYVTTDTITPEMIAGLAAGAATVIVGLFGSSISKITARRKLVVALASPVGVTESLVNTKIALGMPVPSVLTKPDVVPVPVKPHG
jgi:hypothetical protein